MRNIKLTVTYDGTDYHGFQVQQGGLGTIQGVLEERISSLVGEPVRVIGSGRTDLGVHALEQVINFRTTSAIPVERWARSLNRRLPSDIRVLEAQEVAPDFHARYSACGKSYRYLLAITPKPNPVLLRYTWWVGIPLDLARMTKAAGYLSGTHDFKSFQTAGSSTQTSVRTVRESRITLLQEQVVAYDITADGFLYNMVRNIVGLLYRIGTGKVPAREVQSILTAKDRSLVGKLAPPQGLWLTKVWY